ncbi:MAG: hypothetical protein KIT56_10010 [Gammaproteobacteria bacterium]|nr:hypothetical protein [Gammaproteobacteria bacterium]
MKWQLSTFDQPRQPLSNIIDFLVEEVIVPHNEEPVTLISILKRFPKLTNLELTGEVDRIIDDTIKSDYQPWLDAFIKIKELSIYGEITQNNLWQNLPQFGKQLPKKFNCSKC